MEMSKSDFSPGDEHSRGLMPPINQVERRQLTVMFCDLVNSTALASRLELEDLLRVIREYRNLCVAITRNYDGFIAFYMGDGAMICFGYPRAHEEDAERAVCAAMDLISSIKPLKIRLSDGNTIKISVRIGIATGLVLVGNSNGGAAAGETVVGETPNLAARLQSLAQPDTAVVASATRDLVKHYFRLKNIGEYSLRGFEKRQTLWQVIHATHAKTRFQAVRNKKFPGLTGRNKEFKRIIQLWNLAQRDDGRVALISGEAGIGKSKLVETLREYLVRQNANQHLYQCPPFHRNQGCCSIAPRSPRRLKEQALSTLATQLDKPIEQHPLLIILEDAHWMDSTSLELLHKLIPQIRGKPVLLVITHRPEFTPPGLWSKQQHVEHIPLEPLNRSAAELLIRQIIDARRLSSRLIARIIDKGDGVPFFLEELTRMVLRTQPPSRKNGSRAGLPPSLEEPEIPETLRAALMARLDKHSSAREAAQLGAALGLEFSYDLLAEIWMYKREKLDCALHSLCRSGLLVKSEDKRNPRYTFRHTLVREVAYESILKSVRQNLHRQIIRVLEQRFPEYAELQPELLAHHYNRAGVLARVIEKRAGSAATF